MAATLIGTYSVWENKNNQLTYTFTIESNFCLETQGLFFLYGMNSSYVFQQIGQEYAPLDTDIAPDNPF